MSRSPTAHARQLPSPARTKKATSGIVPNAIAQMIDYSIQCSEIGSSAEVSFNGTLCVAIDVPHKIVDKGTFQCLFDENFSTKRGAIERGLPGRLLDIPSLSATDDRSRAGTTVTPAPSWICWTTSMRTTMSQAEASDHRRDSERVQRTLAASHGRQQYQLVGPTFAHLSQPNLRMSTL